MPSIKCSTMSYANFNFFFIFYILVLKQYTSYRFRLRLSFFSHHNFQLLYILELKRCGVELDNMCNLMNDCGDWSDESADFCLDNFECKNNDKVSRVISKSQLCDGLPVLALHLLSFTSITAESSQAIYHRHKVHFIDFFIMNKSPFIIC